MMEFLIANPILSVGVYLFCVVGCLIALLVEKKWASGCVNVSDLIFCLVLSLIPGANLFLMVLFGLMAFSDSKYDKRLF